MRLTTFTFGDFHCNNKWHNTTPRDNRPPRENRKGQGKGPGVNKNQNVKHPGTTRSTFGLKIISENPDVDAKKKLAETEEEDNA